MSERTEPNNLDATVFVFRHRETGEIVAHYASASRTKSDHPDWEHVGSLEPRLWIQAHWNDAAAEREACARVCDFEVRRLTAIDEPRPALAVGICAAAIRARGNA